MTESSAGQLLYQFRRPWRDGSTALLLDPLELLGRLAALVPPPGRPLLAYHGLLGPRARWRAAIVPPPTVPEAARPADSARSRWPGRLPWATLLRRRFTAFVDTALESPLGQIAMIPMLAWIANSAPPNLKATHFAVMAPSPTLALSLSQLGTKYQ